MKPANQTVNAPNVYQLFKLKLGWWLAIFIIYYYVFTNIDATRKD